MAERQRREALARIDAGFVERLEAAYLATDSWLQCLASTRVEEAPPKRLGLCSTRVEETR